MDHAQLVHAQWTRAAAPALSIFVKRAATDDNVSDLPLRGVRVCFAHVSVARVRFLTFAGFCNPSGNA
jgi:hypothetical protein